MRYAQRMDYVALVEDLAARMREAQKAGLAIEVEPSLELVRALERACEAARQQTVYDRL